MRFSKPNDRRLNRAVMLTLLLTSLILLTFHVSPRWAKTDQTNASEVTTEYQASQTDSAKSLYITPSLIEKNRSDVNTTFEVNVTVEDVSDLFGFDFNLTWNNTLITLRSVRFEASLDQLWGHDQWFVAANQTGPGWYKLVAVSLSTSFSGINSVVLATLEFRVENVPAGETPIHFALVKLSDSNWTPIPIDEIIDATYRMLPKTMLEVFPNLIEKADPQIGTYFNASITIENVTDLFGFDFNITWDNTLITYHTCYCADALDAVWGSGNWQLLKSESGTGWYKIVAVSTKNGFTKDPGIQTLFALEFRVEDPHTTGVKETTLHFTTHKLSNSQAEPIQHSAVDAQYEITINVYTLTVSSVGSGIVSLNASGPYHYDDVVRLTAIPAMGWSFKYWSGNLAGFANPATLVMTDDFSVTANFALPNLYVDPSSVNRTYQDAGSYFNVSVKIESITDLFGFDLNITWDNTLMTFSRSYYNDSLNTLWGAAKWYVAKNEAGAGWHKLVAVSTTDSFNTTGKQTLFILEFRVEEPHSNMAKQTPIHFDTHKLSNSQYSAITHTTEDGTYRVTGETPILTMSPTSKTCRIYGETFTIGTNMSDAFDVTDFEFEIQYNTTLLDYVSVTWNAWGPGTITVDEANGNITVSNSGTSISGTQTLITVEFKAAYYHVWKVAPGWTNDLSDIIFFQWANLSYPSGPDLRYERGGSSQISVGPDFAYTFSPIQGDVNNDGTVDIMDLRTVAIYYLVKQGDPEWTQASTYDLNGDGIVDVFDLRTAASNHGYTYVP